MRMALPRRSSLAMAWLQLLLLSSCCFTSIVHSFYPSTTYTYPYHSSSPTRLAATVSFSGDSRASLDILASTSSVQEWLQSSDSDRYLLGTTDPQQRPDGLWDCRQPRIDFLGLDLVPIFVHELGKSQQQTTTTVTIVDARTEILKTTGANRVIASVMENSKFVGKSIIRATSTTDRSSCKLSVELTLTLQVPLPPFVFLPPGFNTVGSAIIRQTGASRTKELLEDLKQAYQEWITKSNQRQDDDVVQSKNSQDTSS